MVWVWPEATSERLLGYTGQTDLLGPALSLEGLGSQARHRMFDTREQESLPGGVTCYCRPGGQASPGQML